MPGFVSNACRRGELNAAGVGRLCAVRYASRRGRGAVDHAIYNDEVSTIDCYSVLRLLRTPVACPGKATEPAPPVAAFPFTSAASFEPFDKPFGWAFVCACAAADVFAFRACAAAAICRSRMVEVSERVSSGTGRFLAGGMLYGGARCADEMDEVTVV